VIAVGELYEQNPYIFARSEDQLLDVLLLALDTAIFDLTELRDAVDDESDGWSERDLDRFERYLGIFSDIMKEAGGYGFRIHLPIEKMISGLLGVLKIRLSGSAALALMGILGKGISPTNQGIRLFQSYLLDIHGLVYRFKPISFKFD
jgi:hypothetical protein